MLATQVYTTRSYHWYRCEIWFDVITDDSIQHYRFRDTPCLGTDTGNHEKEDEDDDSKVIKT